MTYFALQRFSWSWLDFCVDIPFLDSVWWKVWNSVIAFSQLFPLKSIFNWLTHVFWQGWRKSSRFSSHCKHNHNILLHCLSRFCIFLILFRSVGNCCCINANYEMAGIPVICLGTFGIVKILLCAGIQTVLELCKLLLCLLRNPCTCSPPPPYFLCWQ